MQVCLHSHTHEETFTGVTVEEKERGLGLGGWGKHLLLVCGYAAGGDDRQPGASHAPQSLKGACMVWYGFLFGCKFGPFDFKVLPQDSILTS